MTTIKVTVPKKSDDVYIVGNQEALGNWQPDKVKMEKISDYERAVTLPLSLPAEFKFTRGSWESEGIVRSLHNNPNLIIDDKLREVSFTEKTWMDNLEADWRKYLLPTGACEHQFQ